MIRFASHLPHSTTNSILLKGSRPISCSYGCRSGGTAGGLREHSAVQQYCTTTTQILRLIFGTAMPFRGLSLWYQRYHSKPIVDARLLLYLETSGRMVMSVCRRADSSNASSEKLTVDLQV